MKKVYYEIKGCLCLTECDIRKPVRVHSSMCCCDCTNFKSEGKDEKGTFVICRSKEIEQLFKKK